MIDESTAVIIVTALTMLFPIREGLKDALMFKDLGTGSNKKQYKKQWHALDAIWQVLFFIAITAILLPYSDYQIEFAITFSIFQAALFWLVNDAIINTIGLNKPITYIGNTSFTDKLLREIGGENAGAFFIGLKVLLVLIAGALAYNAF